MQVDGITYTSFASSAKDLGIFTDVTEAQICMEEAVGDFCTPYQLKCLFVTLVVQGAPAREIFDTFTDYLVQDYIVNHDMTQAQAFNSLLFDIQQKLETAGKTLQQLGLPEPQFGTSELDRQRLYDEKSCWAKFEESQKAFNEEQSTFFDKIQESLTNADGKPFFLNGPAGSFSSQI